LHLLVFVLSHHPEAYFPMDLGNQNYGILELI